MRIILILCATVVVFAAGCQGIGSATKPTQEAEAVPELALASALRFSDIPVPRGFTYLKADSWTYEAAGGVRLADLRYRGKASLQSVTDFFEEQMPISGWLKEMSVGPETKKRLIFKHSKKSERCKVVVETRGGYTYVSIEID